MQGNIHAGTRWRKSTRSGGGENCVEVAEVGAVRDSKNADGPVIVPGHAALGALFDAARAGRLDLA
jgi:hypothetical protein